MLCPKCMSKSSVVDSRPIIHEGVKTIRRRRICTWCSHSYRTLEVLEISKPKEPKKPKPLKRPKKRKLVPRTKKPTVFDVDNMTDEQLEEAMMSGRIRFDEDEL